MAEQPTIPTFKLVLGAWCLCNVMLKFNLLTRLLSFAFLPHVHNIDLLKRMLYADNVNAVCIHAMVKYSW